MLQHSAGRQISISIHALLAESDVMTAPEGRIIHNFYPRSPCGERLLYGEFAMVLEVISIHALLAESDFKL